MGPLIRQQRLARWDLLVIVLVLGACLGSGDPPVTDPGQADQPPDGEAPIVDWFDATRTVNLDNGWSITACEGDAPLLCVDRDSDPVGVVEAMAYPVETLGWFDPDADIEENLATLADEFARAIGSDRAAGCGSDYLFEPFQAEPFVLGNTPGIAFGFAGTMPDGTSSELNLQYATIVEDRIISIVASAHDDGGCPGRDDLGGFYTTDLAEFRPHLGSVLHESPLPALER